MSRIGRLPILLPGGVLVANESRRIIVEGPKGVLTTPVIAFLDVYISGSQVVVTRCNESKAARANHGLLRSLVSNMIHGVTRGFEKKLEIVGVGYRADVRGKELIMQLGYSHPIHYAIPASISINVDKKNVITVFGIDKQLVGQVAAEIRRYRRPDHYKGKGVRYQGEYVRLKAGKSA